MSIEYTIIGDDVVLLVDPSKLDLHYNDPLLHIIFLGDGDDSVVSFIEVLLGKFKKMEIPLENIIIYDVNIVSNSYDGIIKNMDRICARTNMKIPVQNLIENINGSNKLYHTIFFVTNVDDIVDYNDMADIFWKNISHDLQIQSHTLSFYGNAYGLNNFASVVASNMDYFSIDESDENISSNIAKILFSKLSKLYIMVAGIEYDIIILDKNYGYLVIPNHNILNGVTLKFIETYDIIPKKIYPTHDMIVYYITYCLNKVETIVFSQLFHPQKIKQISALQNIQYIVDAVEYVPKPNRTYINIMLSAYKNLLQKILDRWNHKEKIDGNIYRSIMESSFQETLKNSCWI